MCQSVVVCGGVDLANIFKKGFGELLKSNFLVLAEWWGRKPRIRQLEIKDKLKEASKASWLL